MIVSTRIRVGPDDELTMNPGMLSSAIENITVYGRSTQSAMATPSSPQSISSVADGGTLTVTVTNPDAATQTASTSVSGGLRGIEVVGGVYLKGNGLWLMDQAGRKLKARGD